MTFRRLLTILAGAGVAALALRWASAPLGDPDLFWHLAAGREMVRIKSILRTDVFSHTLAGTPWIDFEWLSQILLYGVYRAGGWGGLYILELVTVFGAIVALGIAVRAARARGWIGIALMLGGTAALRPRLADRIELVTLVAFSLVLAAMAAIRRMSDQQRARLPWWLALLTAVWCNLHAGFVLGIGLVIAVRLGAAWSHESPALRSTLNRSIAFMLLAALVNPWGPKLFYVFIEHSIQIRGASSIIQEWAPLLASDQPLFWVALLLAGFVGIRGIIRRVPEAYFWMPTLLVFSVWGGLAYRNAPFSALVLFISATDIFIGTEGDPLLKQTLRKELIAWTCVVAVLFIAHIYTPLTWPLHALDEWYFPKAAAQVILREKPAGRLYNSYDFGGALDWLLAPAIPIFSDGRYIFFPLAHEEVQLNARLFFDDSPEPWQRFLDRYKITYALVENREYKIAMRRSGGPPFSISPYNAMFPRDRWALIYWDDRAFVFVRRNSDNAAVIQRCEYRALWPYNIAQTIFLIGNGQIDRNAALGELKRHRDEVPFSVIRSELEQQIVRSAPVVQRH